MFELLTASATELFTGNHSLIIHFFASFCLGFLLSLTPCIFPMIPITLAILQGSGNNSRIRSFGMAVSYSLGISLTFALFGLLVSSGSIAFGIVTTTPFFTLSLITLLGYFALSLLGLYEMKLPQIGLFRIKKEKNTSFFTAFLSGALCGTISSPCLSPGLALVLTAVSSLGNSTLGFIMLFIFGIGSSLPLIVLGTFSGSLKQLPKPGYWMLEVKRFFGLLLLALCLFYLKRVMTASGVAWVTAELLFLLSLYYYSLIATHDTKKLIFYKKSISFCSIILACITGTNSINQYYTEEPTKELPGSTNCFTQAVLHAEQQHKKICVIYTMDACPSCVMLEKKLLEKEVVKKALNNYSVVVLDDLTDLKKIIEDLPLLPTPSILILEINQKKVIHQWDGSISNTLTPEEFAQQLKRLA
jgi:thiol:disulfide interchange protein